MSKVQEVVRVDFGQDKAGRWYWRKRGSTIQQVGPFATHAEAIADFERILFGDCPITQGGKIDVQADASDAEIFAAAKRQAKPRTVGRVRQSRDRMGPPLK